MDIATTIATDHETRLDRLAEVAVHVGLGGLKPGQQLVMTAPLEALALTRRITEHAYRAGASLVTTLFSDDAAALLRYQHASTQLRHRRRLAVRGHGRRLSRWCCAPGDRRR